MLNWIDITNQDNDYFLKYQFKQPDMQPLQAAYFTIDYIKKKYPPPYTLMLSGGVDSQAMLYAWHTSNTAYQTFSGVYNNNLNENDLITLRQFSSDHDISINYVDIDMLHFLEFEHENYVFEYRCGSPHMTAFMKMMEKIKEGTVILSGNYIQYNNPYFLPISQNNFALYRFAIKKQKHVVPFFFCETQELACSFYKDFSYENEASRRDSGNGRDKEYYEKVLLYQRHNFPVIPQNTKLTGFELIKDYYDQKFNHKVTVKDKLVRHNKQNSKRVFDLLLRNKYEALFSIDKYKIIGSKYV